MATKAGILHERLSRRTRSGSLRRRIGAAVTAMLHRTAIEADPLMGWQARAELGRETGVRC